MKVWGGLFHVKMKRLKGIEVTWYFTLLTKALNTKRPSGSTLQEAGRIQTPVMFSGLHRTIYFPPLGIHPPLTKLHCQCVCYYLNKNWHKNYNCLQRILGNIKRSGFFFFPCISFRDQNVDTLLLSSCFSKSQFHWQCRCSGLVHASISRRYCSEEAFLVFWFLRSFWPLPHSIPWAIDVGAVM